MVQTDKNDPLKTDSQQSTDLDWFAIHVKSRHEFKVHERLTKNGIDTFLPYVEKLRRWKDRKKLVNFPLFPGYLFVHINKTNIDKFIVLKTPGVVNFLSMGQNEPAPVSDFQIMTLKIIMNNKKKIDPYPYLKEGQKVEIKKGPLAGVHGILIKKETQHILVIAVDILRKGLYIKIDVSDIDA